MSNKNRQGLPICGDANDKDSNFKQFLKLRAEDDLVFSK